MEIHFDSSLTTFWHGGQTLTLDLSIYNLLRVQVTAKLAEGGAERPRARIA